MDTITPFIGFAIFPVAIIASFIGYGASGSSRTIGAVLVITVITAVVMWAAIRSQSRWRSSAKMSNELLMAMLVATIGVALLIGGIAAISPVWMAAGVVLMAGAWLIQRFSSPVAS